jgi:hypothetical protein
MKIKIKKDNYSILNLMRKLGYHPDNRSADNSYSRPLQTGKFPRFHIYHNADRNQLNLHLDQKAPRYKGVNDHGGEYNGKAVEEEAKRIKNIIN